MPDTEDKTRTNGSNEVVADGISSSQLDPQTNDSLVVERKERPNEEKITNRNSLGEVVTNDKSNSRQLNPQINCGLETDER